MTAADRYISGQYALENASWHEADAAWKAAHVARVIEQAQLRPRTVCDIGCGTGGVLDHLGGLMPGLELLVGYDIAASALRLAPADRRDRIEFVVGGPASDDRTFDVALILDVLEHVEDPFEFLRSSSGKARRFVFHIPLDLTVVATLRPGQYARLRQHSGHIHYFTRETALAMLSDCGYRVIHADFTSGAIEQCNAEAHRWLIPLRRLVRAFSVALAARTLGGFSLLVVAEAPAVDDGGRR